MANPPDGSETIEELAGENPLIYAALIFLRRELSKVDSIVLTELDFQAWEGGRFDGVNFQLGENREIILTHVSAANDA